MSIQTGFKTEVKTAIANVIQNEFSNPTKRTNITNWISNGAGYQDVLPNGDPNPETRVDFVIGKLWNQFEGYYQIGRDQELLKPPVEDIETQA